MNYLRSLAFSTFLLTGCSASGVAPPVQPSKSDRHTAPEQAVQAYFTASDRCSSQILRSAFHPAAHLQWLDKTGAPNSEAQLPWWQSLDTANPCRPAVERQLRVLDREGPVALVEANSRFATFRYHDLLLVADSPKGWVIVDKFFERLEGDESPAPADEAAIRRVLDDNVAAARTSDTALLASSHLDDCIYSAVHVRGVPYARESVSEWGARYAERKGRNEDGRSERWRVLRVGASGTLGYAKLEGVSGGARSIHHLLLLRTGDGWRIAAVAWGEPAG